MYCRLCFRRRARGGKLEPHKDVRVCRSLHMYITLTSTICEYGLNLEMDPNMINCPKWLISQSN